MSKGFSTDEFKKRKKQKKDTQSKANTYPDWLDMSKEKVVLLVDGVNSEFKRIQQLIDEEGSDISVSERQIKNITICNFANVTKSYLRADRRDTAKVLQHIKDKNNILADLWKKNNSTKTSSGRKLLRSELETEVTKLKTSIKKEKGRNYVNYFQQWVDLYLVDDRKRLAAKINDQKNQIDELNDEVLSLKSDLRDCRKSRLKRVK